MKENSLINYAILLKYEIEKKNEIERKYKIEKKKMKLEKKKKLKFYFSRATLNLLFLFPTFSVTAISSGSLIESNVGTILSETKLY